MPSLFRLLVLAALAGCTGTPTDPEIRPPAELTLMRLKGDHPDYFNTESVFWAKPGRDVEGTLSFKDEAGERGEEYVRLRIRPGSLKAFPDGRAIGPQDSVLITLRMVNQDSLLVEVLPSGLQFDSAEPAEFTVQYDQCDLDLNRDGVLDSRDAALLRGLAVWRQAQPDGPFVKLPSVNREALLEMEASVLGFSRLAVAY